MSGSLKTQKVSSYMPHAIGGGMREREAIEVFSHHLPKLREEQQTAQAHPTFATRKTTSEERMF